MISGYPSHVCSPRHEQADNDNDIESLVRAAIFLLRRSSKLLRRGLRLVK
jgi:hypothetical protein